MRSAGFTLIELIAVLVLVGLFLVFAPPALEGLVPERRLQEEASRLGTKIEFLIEQAILNRARYAMHYDTEEHRWAVQIPEERTVDQSDPDAEPVTLLVLDEDVDPSDLQWHRLPEDMTLELYEGSRQILDGRWAVTIRPSGGIDPHILVLHYDRIASLDENERTRTIKVNFPGFVSYAVGKHTDDHKKTEAELGR